MRDLGPPLDIVQKVGMALNASLASHRRIAPPQSPLESKMLKLNPAHLKQLVVVMAPHMVNLNGITSVSHSPLRLQPAIVGLEEAVRTLADSDSCTLWPPTHMLFAYVHMHMCMDAHGHAHAHAHAHGHMGMCMCTQALSRARTLLGFERAADEKGLDFVPGQRGEGGPGSALVHDGNERAADEKGLVFVPGQRGEGGSGSALVRANHERAADEKGLDFVPGQRGEGGPGSALTLDGLKKKGKDKASLEAIALKAKEKCDQLDALGQPGWEFKITPRADGTGTNVTYGHPVLWPGKTTSFSKAQKVAKA